MEKVIKWYLKNHLLLSKGLYAEVDRVEIISVMQSYGIPIPESATKKNLVNAIYTSKYCDQVLELFKDRFHVPSYILTKIYNITHRQLYMLSDTGIIKEPYVIRNYSNSKSGHRETRAYAVESLTYNPVDLKKQLEELDKCIHMRLKICADTELDGMLDQCKRAFDIVGEPRIYDGHGTVQRYVYLNVKIKNEESVSV